MNEHRHPTYVDGCYRCNLSQDEVEVDHNAMREAIMSDLSDLERQLADANARADAAEADRDRHANLLDENAQLRELCGYLIDACAKNRMAVPFHSSLQDLMADIAGGAAAVSPPPAPTTLSGDCSIDCLERCAYPGLDSACEIGAPPAPTTCPTCGYREWERCPDSWHQAAT